MFLKRFFIFARLSLLRSNFFRQMMFIVSRNSWDLILRSRGDSVAKEGLRLTSMSQGFKS